MATSDRWGYSSGVEHSTADREVPGSIPGVPLLLLGFFNHHFQIILDESFSSGTITTINLSFLETSVILLQSFKSFIDILELVFKISWACT